jgi:hypothetical protein
MKRHAREKRERGCKLGCGWRERVAAAEINMNISLESAVLRPVITSIASRMTYPTAETTSF